MLPSPDHAVIGVSDLEEMTRFLALFGFEERRRGELPAAAASALYELEEAAEEVTLEMPGAERGGLRLVRTPHPPRSVAPLDSRPFAIDLFATDIERSVELAAEHGLEASPVAVHRFGPITVKEMEIHGPDRLILTLLDTEARRPSLLDQEPDRPYSEVHALVWSVRGMDRLLPFWREQAAHEVVTDATFESPELGPLLGVGERALEARLAVFADPSCRPVRLEMIEFLGEEAASHPSLPLAAGLHAPAFQVESLTAVRQVLSGAEWGKLVEIDSAVHPVARAARAAAPGGLVFEVWERAG